MNNKDKIKEIAEWMNQRLINEELLYQEIVVHEISEKFGEKYTYLNDNGNLAIDKDVLKEFRKLTEDTVVWERGERFWRKRGKYDEPGKRLSY